MARFEAFRMRGRIHPLCYPRFKVRKVVFCSVLCGCVYLLLKTPVQSSLDFSMAKDLYSDKVRWGTAQFHRLWRNRNTTESEQLFPAAKNSTDSVRAGTHSKDRPPSASSTDSVLPAGRSRDAGHNAIHPGNATELPWCPDQPPVTDHAFPVNVSETTYAKLVAEVGKVMKDGGHFLPSTCRSREHLAIIVPYRDRERNLLILLRNLLPFLWRQMVEFTVFLVEQTEEHLFNKGVLFNAAYKESRRLGNFTCFVMQDVDLVPMDNRNLYRCGHFPRHLCLTAGQTVWKNKMAYPTTFGGAIALRQSHIEAANGFSVSYYGWGLEDDDLYIRLTSRRLRIDRYAIMTGKYYRLDHEKEAPNTQWIKLRKTIRQRQKAEGLNTLNYTLVRREERPLYTRLLIRVPPPPSSIYDTAAPSSNRSQSP